MDETSNPGVVPGIIVSHYSDGKWQQRLVSVPREFPFTIYLNNVELVTIMCSPVKLNCLVLGYLYSEGFIKDTKEVVSMRVCEDDSLADVKLNRTDVKLPEKRVLTSGCGGGISFNVDAPKIESDVRFSPASILELMKKLLQGAAAYNLAGGIHTSGLGDAKDLVAVAEDIGRHNTLDKLIGECLLRKIPTPGKVLLASGRVSSEMLRKAAIMQTPIIVSLTSPTERAVIQARDLGVTLIGYARGTRLTVYSRPERLQ